MILHTIHTSSHLINIGKKAFSALEGLISVQTNLMSVDLNVPSLGPGFHWPQAEHLDNQLLEAPSLSITASRLVPVSKSLNDFP